MNLRQNNKLVYNQNYRKQLFTKLIYNNLFRACAAKFAENSEMNTHVLFVFKFSINSESCFSY